jgi:hypothetical protein
MSGFQAAKYRKSVTVRLGALSGQRKPDEREDKTDNPDE